MKNLFLTILLGLGIYATAQAQNTRNVSQYNLEAGIALKGYDPVSYFAKGGSQPQMGQMQFKLNYMGATYMFATAQNLDLFVENPDKYEPTYGGWCAYAMASGSKVDIQPTVFTINGNRIHFFVSKRAKRNFDNDLTSLEAQADQNWKQLSGEDPRL